MKHFFFRSCPRTRWSPQPSTPPSGRAGATTPDRGRTSSVPSRPAVVPGTPPECAPARSFHAGGRARWPHPDQLPTVPVALFGRSAPSPSRRYPRTHGSMILADDSPHSRPARSCSPQPERVAPQQVRSRTKSTIDPVSPPTNSPSNPPPVVKQDHSAPTTNLRSSRESTNTLLEQRYRRNPMILGK